MINYENKEEANEKDEHENDDDDEESKAAQDYNYLVYHAIVICYVAMYSRFNIIHSQSSNKQFSTRYHLCQTLLLKQV